MEIKTNIKDILERVFSSFGLDEYRDPRYDNMPLYAKNLTAILNATYIDKSLRQQVVTDEIGADPWSWCNIPNFSELEEAEQENVIVVFEDGEEISAPLLY